MIGLNPGSTGARINLVESLNFGKIPAQLEDFVPGLDLGIRKINIVVACMPKSGSTWLQQTLRTLTGFDQGFYTFAFLQNENDLYLPEVAEAASKDCVVQQHCRATAANVQIMQAFEIRPIVLVRNLFDALVSMADFYAKGASRNSFMTEFDKLDRETQIDAIIDNFSAWYLQCYASWMQVEEMESLPFMWMMFEEMMGDKPAALKRIVEFHGLGKSENDITKTLSDMEDTKNQTRFNKGVAGRGETELTQVQRDRIRRMADYYPSIDMGRIGL